MWRKVCFSFLTVCLYRLQTVSHVTYMALPANRYLTLQPSCGHIFNVFRDICLKFGERNPTTIFSTAMKVAYVHFVLKVDDSRPKPGHKGQI